MVDDAVDGQLFEVPESSEVRPGRGGVDKKFRAYMPDQMWLMPPSVDDWLPEDHLARLVSELVDEVFDLGRFYAAYTEKRGFPPYDPRLMVKVLVFGYTTGVRSSRAIERHCHESVAFRFLAANQQPDFRSVARFRERHLEALEELFNQILMLCVEAGMVALGEVALDGSKVRANASRRKAGSYGRMGDTEARLADEVADMMADAEATDAAEDEKYGSDGRHEDLPGELARRETRLAKIHQAKMDLEADARRTAGADAARKAWHRGRTNNPGPTQDGGTATGTRPAKGPRPSGSGPAGGDGHEPSNSEPSDQPEGPAPTPDAGGGGGLAREDLVHQAADDAAGTATPETKAQRNFTDPDARIMKTSDGSFHYCYNTQTVADGASQVIVATRLTNRSADSKEFGPMIDEVTRNLGVTPPIVLADAGYFSDDNVATAQHRGVDAYIATGRLKHADRPPPAPRGPIPKDATPKQRMARKLRTKTGKTRYARRKAIIEPVFGQIDTVQGGKHVLLRGLAAAQSEWTFLAAGHNIRKLHNHTRRQPKPGS